MIEAKVHLVRPGAKLRHYKGGLYEVVCTAKLEATQETHLVYRSGVWPYTDAPTQTWVRPWAECFELVEWNGEKLPRFAVIEETK